MTGSRLAAGAALMIALPVLAQAADFTEMDTNEDGVLTLSELQAALPDFTEADFTAADVNADGGLNEDEMRAAQAAGILPASEG